MIVLVHGRVDDRRSEEKPHAAEEDDGKDDHGKDELEHSITSSLLPIGVYPVDKREKVEGTVRSPHTFTAVSFQQWPLTPLALG